MREPEAYQGSKTWILRIEYGKHNQLRHQFSLLCGLPVEHGPERHSPPEKIGAT